MPRTKPTVLIATALMMLCFALQAEAQQEKGGVKKGSDQSTKTEAEQEKKEVIIADFESKKSIAKSTTSHKATVTLVDDVPKGGGKKSVKTVVKDAKATGHFGTGFGIPALDLSGSGEIRFWIKTDAKSKFNLQIHSEGKRASVFRFSTVDSKAETWTQIKVPLDKLSQPK